MKYFAFLLTALLYMGAACAADQPADVIATLKADARFKTLAGALDDVQLSEALKLTSSVTVFAPTDDAFRKLPDLTALLNDKARLKATLQRHFVTDKKMAAADLAKMNALIVSDGSTLRIGDDGKKIGDATVIAADIPASNGVIHAIDAVFPATSIPVVTEVRADASVPAATTTATTDDRRFTESRNRFKEAGDTMHDGLKTGSEKVGDGVKTGAEKVGDGVKSGADTVGDGLKTGASKIKRAFGF